MSRLNRKALLSKKVDTISNRDLTVLAKMEVRTKEETLNLINKERIKKGLLPIIPKGIMSVIKTKKVIYPSETELDLINFLGKQKEKITRDEIIEKMKIKRNALSTSLRILKEKGFPIKEKLIPKNKKRD